MISNISKLLTVQLSPLLAVVSTFLILFTYLGPVPIFQESVNLVSIVPGSAQRTMNIRSIATADLQGRRLPRAAAVAIVQRAEDKNIDGPILRFGLLGSCIKPSGADSVCTGASLYPVYDISALSKTTPFPSAPPKTSPSWILVSIVFMVTYLLLTALPSLPRMPAAVSNFLNKPFCTRAIAWLGIIGWFAGLTTAIVLRVTFENSCNSFNQDASDGRVEMVAIIGNGFNMFWIAYALAVPSLICSLFKLHLEAKSS